MESLDSFLHIILVNILLNFTNEFGIKFTVSVSYNVSTCVQMWICYGTEFSAQTWLHFAPLDGLELKHIS